MKPLSDLQMQEFIENGYLILKAGFTPSFHESVRVQAENIFSSRGNPGNEILPAIPQLTDLFSHPVVTGALTGILGHGYVMHPHRHCHLTPPGQAAQRHHQDSYEDDQNVRHHRTRWAMAFYYPQDVPPQLGPTSVLPASQYYTSRAQAERRDEALLCGDAGTVTIVHYDLWHRATANRGNRNRFMLKFLFCRVEEPTVPSWDNTSPVWRGPATGGELPRLWRSVWNWYLGNEAAQDCREGAHNTGATSAAPDCSAGEEANGLTEAERLQRVYHLSNQGQEGSKALQELVVQEAEALLESNLAAQHTNPSQLNAIFGLSAQGAAAVPYLRKLLRSEKWPVRAAAADTLGDIGRPATNAVPGLLDCLEDDSEWVRRNAVEALGNIASPAAVAQLACLLRSDTCHFVRHNAALSLAKIGPEAVDAHRSLTLALDDDNLYVRENARLALGRIGNI